MSDFELEDMDSQLQSTLSPAKSRNPIPSSHLSQSLQSNETTEGDE